MAEYHIITKPGCPHCVQAKATLDRKGLTYTVDNRETEEEIGAFKALGYRSFPQIFHGDVLVGGNDKLIPYLDSLSDEF